MTRGTIFVPNFSCGPCVYCKKTSEATPEDLLKCDTCKRSAHFNCLKSGIPKSRLLGDNFFHFTCRECTPKNSEIVTRAELSFIQTLLLSLYNLHMTKEVESSDGYFHYKKHIYDFIKNNWLELYCYDGHNFYKEQNKLLPNRISGQLSHCPLFTAKKVERGRGGWYRLVSIEAPVHLIQKSQQSHQRKRLLPPDVEAPREEPSKVPSKVPKVNPTDLSTVGASSSLSSSASSSSSTSSVTAKEEKEELCEESSSTESVDESSRGSWFRDWVKPEPHLPPNIFADEEDAPLDVEETTSTVTPCQESPAKKASDTPPQPSEEEQQQQPFPKPKCSSLFTRPKTRTREKEDVEREDEEVPLKRIVPISYYEERKLLKKLDDMQCLTPELYRIRRKLKVRQMKREHNLPIFNVDAEVKFLETNDRLMTDAERKMTTNLLSGSSWNSERTRILDRFQVPEKRVVAMETDDTSFRARLIGASGDSLEFIYSPYSLRKMKPFIFRDFATEPLKLKLLQEIVAYGSTKRGDHRPPSRRAIDYCYVTPKHIPAMNHLAREFFWPGIDLSEVLHYPDFTCVVLYGHLVVGFGTIVPDTCFNEAYVSFLFVHPEWRRVGIAKFILYHLIQTCSGKDITLHVSATNPALIMYQQFGFKVEEFLSDFYDKYLPEDSPQCKHAMFMRLRR